MQALRQLKTPEFPSRDAIEEAALCALTEFYMRDGWTFEQAAWAAEMERDNDSIDWYQALSEVKNECAA